VAEATGISWCDATFNPWMGCTNVSPGCGHCYAKTLTENRMGIRVWADEPRQVTSPGTWAKPLRWAHHARAGRLPDGGENRDGHRPRIFCASLADVFEDHPQLEEPRQRLFELIARTPELDWLILTKRPEFMRDWFAQMPMMVALPLPNVWLGVSIENARFTWRADVLREIPAALRFISAEPLLGSLYPQHGPAGPAERDGLDYRRSCLCGRSFTSRSWEHVPALGDHIAASQGERKRLNLDGIDWIIVGGESGPRDKARPLHPMWVREVRDAVQAVSIDDDPADPTRLRPALHFKQWGSFTPDEFGRDPEGVWLMPDGTRHTSFAADVYGIDLSGAARVRYAGAAPGSGGKFLDGTDWCEFPDAPNVPGPLTLA
jgi:protein gp37